jgi:hypothetical protein
LICLLVKEALHRKQIEWSYFLFWNEFQTEKPPEMKTKRSRSKNHPTNHRRRKGISMSRDSIKAAPSKQEETRKKLKIEDRNPVTTKNPLNLPYSGSDLEQEMSNSQGTLQPKHDAELKTDILPTMPSETHRQPKAEASSSKCQKGKTRKINKLLREIYEMEVLERVIKKANADLTEKVAELFKENETLKEKHNSIKGRNRELIRENMKLYRQLRVLRLRLKKFESPEEKQTGLDTLANLATTIIEVTDSPAKSTQIRKSARIKATASKKA